MNNVDLFGGNKNMLSEYRKCKKCKALVLEKELDMNNSICPNCGNYMEFHARKRIKSLADDGDFIEWEISEEISNPLNDFSYIEELSSAKDKHNLEEAIVGGEIRIGGEKVLIGVMDTRFLMASMGHIVGEFVTKLFEEATIRKIPIILYCCSGGARMQEGIISLMQMEKTAAAVKRHSEAGLLYISVLTNPTMGGVTASFAMLADIILAEKGAMIGFAGPRVIEQNTGQKLPEGFQTAEFQKDHGFIDAISNRESEKQVLMFLLKIHKSNFIKKRLLSFLKWKNQKRIRGYNFTDMTAWDRVKLARQPDRPTSMDYIGKIFDEFYELSGDRISGDDHAIVAGIATFSGRPITVIGNQKGKNSVNDAIYRNWGMASPQGYRKTLRIAKQAEKFNRPIIFFVDTIGAACGKEAEENGQAIAIANLLQEMSIIKVPILSIVIGEGGSGGALALGIGNEVWMLENAVYSILTPEGYASIIWKDQRKAKEAASKMKMEAKDLYDLNIIDYIVKEREPVTKENLETVCDDIKKNLKLFLEKYDKKTHKRIVEERYLRFRKF